jgi:F-type H+-transporting ATPase subunit b
MADAPHIETIQHAPSAERAAEQDAATIGRQHQTSEAPQASAGLPQFQFQHCPSQIAYLLILFAILYVLMSRVFTPRIRKIFDEREATIGGAIASAKQVQAEAATQAQAARQALEESRSKAQKMASDAKARAEAEAKVRRDELENQLAAKMTEAETGIRAARDAAMLSVNMLASELARAIVKKLTGASVSDEQVQASLTDAQG